MGKKEEAEKKVMELERRVMEMNNISRQIAEYENKIAVINE